MALTEYWWTEKGPKHDQNCVVCDGLSKCHSFAWPLLLFRVTMFTWQVNEWPHDKRVTDPVMVKPQTGKNGRHRNMHLVIQGGTNRKKEKGMVSISRPKMPSKQARVQYVDINLRRLALCSIYVCTCPPT